MKSYLLTFLVILSLASIALTIGYVTSHRQSSELRAPERQPPTATQPMRVAGAGIVEASSRNIAIGSFTTGIVAQTPVQPGQKVKKGHLLMQLDAREAEAAVAVQRAALEVARRQLVELKQQPRAEDVAIAQAQVQSAEALKRQQETRLARTQRLADKNAMSAEEIDSIVEAATVAQAELSSARVTLAKLQAGTWEPQIASAEAKVQQAEAALQQAMIRLEQQSVLAPSDGVVLQVNARQGEFVSVNATAGLIVFGDISTLHVRVDIDEVDIPRFNAARHATAMRRGDATTRIPLTLVSTEPLVIPKQTLTGEQQERTDTRVLQAVFRVDAKTGKPPLYVGQQLDVFIDLEESEVEQSNDAQQPKP